MNSEHRLDSWLEKHLVCPRDSTELRLDGDALVCTEEHRFPYVDGIPIMLLPETDRELGIGSRTLDQVASGTWAEEPAQPARDDRIDPYVQKQVAGTCGRMYRPLIGKLPRYPVPDFRLPPAEGDRLLDIGCGWGRWSIAAARKGYRPVGIDASLDAVRAARRVAAELGQSATYLVADARFLPFAAGSFDVVYSYSFIQHLSKSDAKLSLGEIGRVLAHHGISLVEMPNALGMLNVVRQARRWFREPSGFGVRYWRPSELRREFDAAIGPTSLSVDSYFFINGQPSDRDLLPQRYQVLISLSERLRRLSVRAPRTTLLADSLYVHSRRNNAAADREAPSGRG